ncbi:MAG: YabP/YqfC family sporulation protein [Ruminococcus sp.]|nr:YabP/YqfC family sporulation protein [Ruminococcus sp.]
MKKSNENNRKIPLPLYNSLPIIEIIGNREITIEGSTGVLKYESDNIKVNTKSMVVSIEGRNLQLKFLSSSSLVVEGVILSLEFIM